jgi:hypothetical protein
MLLVGRRHAVRSGRTTWRRGWTSSQVQRAFYLMRIELIMGATGHVSSLGRVESVGGEVMHRRPSMRERQSMAVSSMTHNYNVTLPPPLLLPRHLLSRRQKHQRHNATPSSRHTDIVHIAERPVTPRAAPGPPYNVWLPCGMANRHASTIVMSGEVSCSLRSSCFPLAFAASL